MYYNAAILVVTSLTLVGARLNGGRAVLNEGGVPSRVLGEEEMPSNVLKYGDDIFLQNLGRSSRWLSGARGTGNELVVVKNMKEDDYEIRVMEGGAYQWKIQSIPQGVDGKNGDCLRYGDEFYLRLQSRADRWLSGSRSSGNEHVVARDMFSNSYEQSEVSASYKWMARSDTGTGEIHSNNNQDPAHGICIQDFSQVFLQNLFMRNRWLSGGRGSSSGVIVRNVQRDNYELENIITYRWVLKTEAGAIDGSDALGCAAISAVGRWIRLHSVSTDDGEPTQIVKYSTGTEVSNTNSATSTKTWETSVTASITQGFKFLGAEGSASLEVSASYASTLSNTVAKTVSQESLQTYEAIFPGEGQIWQFQYAIKDVCNSGASVLMKDLAHTSNGEPPCCLPHQEIRNLHGPCNPGTPCSCSIDTCDAITSGNSNSLGDIAEMAEGLQEMAQEFEEGIDNLLDAIEEYEDGN